MAPNLRKSFRLQKNLSLSTLNQQNENYWKKVNEGRINKIRASARHKRLQEYGGDLERKIELELRMREGSAKLLAACSRSSNNSRDQAGVIQSLAAAKSLLTSNHRVAAYYANRVRCTKQQQQQQQRCKGMPIRSSRTSAKICLSNLRIPLIWRDSEHFRNKKGISRKFAVFCILRVSSEVYDTELVTVDPTMTDVSFDDVAVFGSLPPDFDLDIELYCHPIEEKQAPVLLGTSLSRRITSSVSKTFGRKLMASLKEVDPLNDAGPSFELIARARLKLNDSSNAVRTHDLLMIEQESGPRTRVLSSSLQQQQRLPLFGHLCCRLAAEANLFRGEISGYLKVRVGVAGKKSSISSELEGHQYWASLENFNLILRSCEEEGEEENGELKGKKTCTRRRSSHASAKQCSDQQRLQIPINRNTTTKQNSSHCFTLCSADAALRDQAYVICVSSDRQQDASHWIAAIDGLKRDYETWERVLQSSPMPILSPSRGGCLLSPTSQSWIQLRTRAAGSLYNETLHDAASRPRLRPALSRQTSSSSSSRYIF